MKKIFSLKIVTFYNLFFLLSLSVFAQPFDAVSVLHDAVGNKTTFEVRDAGGDLPQIIALDKDHMSYHYLYILGDGNYIRSDSPSVTANIITGDFQAPGVAENKLIFSTTGYNGGEPPEEKIIIPSTPTSGSNYTPLNNDVDTLKWIEIKTFDDEIAPALDNYFIALIAVQNPYGRIPNLRGRVHFLYNSNIREGNATKPDRTNFTSPASIHYPGTSLFPRGSASLNPADFGMNDILTWQIDLDSMEKERYIYVAFPVEQATGLDHWVPSHAKQVERSFRFIAFFEAATDLDDDVQDRLLKLNLNLSPDFKDISEHRVKILQAHDPSHVLTRSCNCPGDGKNKLITEIEFTNDGGILARDIKVEFTFPAGIDPDSFNETEAIEVAGSTDLKGNFSKSGNKIIWEFKNINLKPYPDFDDKVFIQFSHKTDAGVDPSALPEMTAQISFDGSANWTAKEKSRILIADENTSFGKELDCKDYCENGDDDDTKEESDFIDYCILIIAVLLALIFAFIYGIKRRENS